MEEIKNASITINLSQGSFSIQGSEIFVEKNMGDVFSFVEKNSSIVQLTQPHENQIKMNSDCENSAIEQKITPVLNMSDKYIEGGIYHIDSEDGSISILKKIPGNNDATKIKNIALIVLHIRKIKIEGKEIISLCEKHNCYDSSNFAAIFNKEKTNIIKKGQGRKWTIELTQPGEEAAVNLLEEMLSANK
ncbi:hypothetical protein [Tannockella kyphosi]|uniref:hypothetical protein n=1 Tax=Tannockella kyphosi TaxID=2899121 RepID=UPI0020133B3D|nr:hypothetical protein [Tannockella kyphosi]